MAKKEWKINSVANGFFISSCDFRNNHSISKAIYAEIKTKMGNKSIKILGKINDVVYFGAKRGRFQTSSRRMMIQLQTRYNYVWDSANPKMQFKKAIFSV
jgi:hypothetical protein